MRKKFYRINYHINAQSLRLLGEDGKQIGIFSLNEAQKQAKEAGLDLVEIAPRANPPVARLIDFKKFLYLEEKKERELRKKTKGGGELKGIRLKPFIAQGDFDFRVRRAEKFIGEGNKVKVDVRFLGRQLSKREFGDEVIGRFIEALSYCSKPESEPKWQGRSLVVVLSPAKPKEEKNDETEKKQDEDKKIGLKKV